MSKSRRNVQIERAAQKAIERIDHFIAGGQVNLPSNTHVRACDTLLATQRASVRVATMFLMFYWLEEPDWDRNSIPTGIRGQYGDKLLSEQLTQRHITLHDNITAFAENLGWKGNVHGFRLRTDARFRAFLSAVKDASPPEKARIADYLADQFAQSKREALPLPRVGPEVLTFVKAKKLFCELLNTPSEGYVQQFLVAALLFEYRRRHSIEVSTRHPHSADASNEAAGDIEERFEGRLIRAYDVTVRPDWQDRLSNFTGKMDKFGLMKFIIIASGINDDDQWSEPANMALALGPYGRDIAIVDIQDVANFLAMELTPSELRDAVNKGFEYLSSHKLCGRDDYKHAYRNVVKDWLGTASEE